MILGGHIIIYSKDPDADRALVRDVLGFPHVDAGNGWLIFALPGAEAAFHPADENDAHEFYLMTDDVAAEIERLRAAGAKCDEIEDVRWGLRTWIGLPGGGKLGLYQPKHPVAIGGA
jgi:catechol 2,3-dioxygenase-like lactoylglutathione lyase family enzyme